MRAFLCFSIPEQQSNCILGSTSVVLRTQCFVVLCFLCLVGGTLSYEEICDSPEQGISNVLDKNSIVDDCCCSIDAVNIENSRELRPLLDQLVKQRFFKYFKLGLYDSCPFWASNFFCETGGCAVCECNEDEIPSVWKQQRTDLVDVKTPPNFVSWKDVEENMWIIQGLENEMSYVNLAMYPEGNTGYDGRMLWDLIYNENCFKGSLGSMCLEERIFYRLISGLHASINIHICKNFLYDEDKQIWIPNRDLFKERIGYHPDRIKNLYFSFLFLLRAVGKADSFLKEYDFDTGNASEKQEVRSLMIELLSKELICSPNFDESTLFKAPEKESIKLQFKQHFRNISLIMVRDALEVFYSFSTNITV